LPAKRSAIKWRRRCRLRDRVDVIHPGKVRCVPSLELLRARAKRSESAAGAFMSGAAGSGRTQASRTRELPADRRLGTPAVHRMPRESRCMSAVWLRSARVGPTRRASLARVRPGRLRDVKEIVRTWIASSPAAEEPGKLLLVREPEDRRPDWNLLRALAPPPPPGRGERRGNAPARKNIPDRQRKPAAGQDADELRDRRSGRPRWSMRKFRPASNDSWKRERFGVTPAELELRMEPPRGGPSLPRVTPIADAPRSSALAAT
jgi:hypothetical protein